MNTGPRSVCTTTTTVGRRVNEKDLNFGWASTETDNHADIHCFGANFRPTQWCDMQCTVSPFLDDLEKSNSVEICSAGTAVELVHGKAVILIFGQGLWFGDRMPNKSLINPNQCRAYGVSYCDDPTDPNRELGLYDP